MVTATKAKTTPGQLPAETAISPRRYFDIKRDIEVVEDGGFFCSFCFTAKPTGELSADTKCCRECFEVKHGERESITALHKDSWGRVISYSDGFAWGVSVEGVTICLGKEGDVKGAIADANLSSGYPDVDDIIGKERELQQKEGENDGKRFRGNEVKRRASKASRRGNIRVRPVRHSRNKRLNARQSKATKRVTLHRS